MLASVIDEGLVERGQELARLGGLLVAAQAGHGRLALIDGPAGIGKTTLLDATCAAATQRRMTVVTARGDELGQDVPYGVVRQLFESLIGVDGLEGMAAHAAPVFDAAAAIDTDVPGSLDHPAAVLHGLYWLAVGVAERRPLLIAVDDAHWSDAPSLGFLNYLALRLDHLPIAVATTTRSGDPHREGDLLRRLATGPVADVLRPGPLSLNATAELLRTLTGVECDPGFSAACHTATGGNPFLLRELSGALEADGVAPTGDAAGRVAGLAPNAVSRQVLVRLARLEPAAARFARAVAVLGSSAELCHAAALAELDELGAARAVDELAAAEILGAGQPLEFRHPMLREAVYAELRPAERAFAHARAALLLLDAGEEAERIAPQLVAGGPAAAAWAVEILRAAARAAMARGAPDIAATYLERALAEPPAPTDRPGLLLELGTAQARAGRPEAAARLGEALETANDPRSRALAALELGRTLFYAHEPERAVAVLGRALDALPDSEPELAVRLETELVMLGYTGLTGRRLVLDRVGRLRARLHELDPETHNSLLAALSIELAVVDGGAADAAQVAERAVSRGGLLRRDKLESTALPCALAVLGACDRLELAERMADEVIGQARRRGSLQLLGHALCVRAELRYRRGKLVDADTDARRAIEGEPEGVFAYGVPYGLAILGYSLIERGELDEAAGLIERDGIPGDDGDTGFSQFLRFARARLHIARGRLEQGLEGILAVGRWERAWGIRYPCWIPWRSEAAAACLALNRRDQAARLADEDLAAARAFGGRAVTGIALRTLGLVSEGPKRLDALREACAMLQESGARLEHARALAELGATLRRSGQPGDSQQPLRLAHELAARCGATVLEDRAHREVLAAGARPRRLAANPVDDLTPAERRVAAMAAEGLSNREVAQTLFLSPKTVEMHLGRVYRKLGLRSRSQLPDALRE